MIRTGEMLLAKKSVNPTEVIMVDAADTIILFSEYPEITVSRKDIVEISTASSAASMLNRLLIHFFGEESLGFVNRAMLEKQHGPVMKSCYGIFYSLVSNLNITDTD